MKPWVLAKAARKAMVERRFILAVGDLSFTSPFLTGRICGEIVDGGCDGRESERERSFPSKDSEVPF